MKVVLASSSPRRREILKLIGLKHFEVFSPEVEEIKVKKPFHVKLNALKKAKAAARHFENALVIAADTAVFLNGRFLGKPKNAEEARRMLAALSGRWHTVYTGVALLLKAKGLKKRLSIFSARVKFSKLSAEEIDWYLSTGEPLDKAGAYGIQGKGALFVEAIRGDFFTVMGLPASGLYKMLKELLGQEGALSLLKINSEDGTQPRFGRV